VPTEAPPCIEARANPEIAEAKAATAKAMQEAEAGWRAAVRKISEHAGLGKIPHDGAEKIARATPTADVK
jgi:hypothetical protein